LYADGTVDQCCTWKELAAAIQGLHSRLRLLQQHNLSSNVMFLQNRCLAGNSSSTYIKGAHAKNTIAIKIR